MLIAFFLQQSIYSQEEKQENTKKGWSFGLVPAVGFDSDVGYRYGGLINLYNYGDGTIYPNYLYSIYLEWSQTTRGNGKNVFTIDSKNLLPNQMRLTGEVSYHTEKNLDFYGFNGYEATYLPEILDTEDPSYVSRLFYRHQRKMLRITADVQGKITDNNKLRWLIGYGFNNFEIAPIDVADLNKGKSDDEQLADTSIMVRYVKDNIIQKDEKNGGNVGFAKLGIVYDSRDNEPNPMSGIWFEAFAIVAPKWLGTEANYQFTKIVAIHRQYFTIIEENLSFAYRLAYQGTIAGRTPFYFQPYIISSFSTNDGLGGGSTMRGILRNRVVGEGIAYGNFELRWKFWHTTLFKQNLYFGLNGFFDSGMVVQKHKINYAEIPQAYKIEEVTDKPHSSVGTGLRIAMNRNFILACDFGVALDKRDGTSGLYIGMGYLF